MDLGQDDRRSGLLEQREALRGRAAAAVHPERHMVDTVAQDGNQTIRQSCNPIFGPASAPMFTGASGILSYSKMLKQIG